MLGKLLNLLGKCLIIIVALLLVCILAVILINLKDQPPSATALEFEQLRSTVKPIDAQKNGYLFLLGFDVAETQNPTAAGIERVEWSKEVVLSAETENLTPPHTSLSLQTQLPVDIDALVNRCSKINKKCMRAIEKNKTLIADWAEQHQWIDHRYQQLLFHDAWLELSAIDMRIPFPNYSEVIKAQRLAFIHAFATRPTDDIVSVTLLLENDLRFWRMVLRDTDMLIGKMIAVAAINNNFLWANQFFLTLNETELTAAVPAELKKPFTESELSMYRSVVGEWLFAQAFTDESWSNSYIDNITGRLLYRLLFKRQDTLNQMATSFKTLSVNLDVPLNEFESALAVQQQKEQPQQPSQNMLVHFLLNPYNPIGQIVLRMSTPAFSNYIARAKDLEAYRRGLLFSVEKMQHTANDESVYTSPYQSKPFVVNTQERSITVTGLNERNNTQQVYVY